MCVHLCSSFLMQRWCLQLCIRKLAQRWMHYGVGGWVGAGGVGRRVTTQVGGVAAREHTARNHYAPA